MFNYKFIELPKLDVIQRRVWNDWLHMDIDDDRFWPQDKADWEHYTELVEAVETIMEWGKVHYVALVTVNPGSRLPIHTDGGGNDRRHPYAVNIPIHNCDKTYTPFYECIDAKYDPKFTNTFNASDSYFNYPEHAVKEIDRMYLTQPAYFRHQTIHSVINPTSEIRVALSVRFNHPIKQISEQHHV